LVMSQSIKSPVEAVLKSRREHKYSKGEFRKWRVRNRRSEELSCLALLVPPLLFILMPT
jgi:hypothetical protein